MFKIKIERMTVVKNSLDWRDSYKDLTSYKAQDPFFEKRAYIFSHVAFYHARKTSI